jgi:hypothetical protein
MSESEKEIYEYEADRANGAGSKSFIVAGLASVLGFGVITASAIGLTSAPATQPVLDGKPFVTQSSEAPVATQTQPQESQAPNSTTLGTSTQPQFGNTEDDDFEDDGDFAGTNVAPQFGGSNFDDEDEDDFESDGQFGFGHDEEDEEDDDDDDESSEHEDDDDEEDDHEGHENS